MNSTIVVGLGNPLMSDDGVGIHVVRRLETQASEFPGVDFVDGGTAASRVPHLVADRATAIFIDCALMGEPPGALRRFTPEEVRADGMMPRVSLHEGDLLGALELSRRLGNCPSRIVIFGIEPQAVGFGECLSPCVAARMNEFVRAVQEELSSAG